MVSSYRDSGIKIMKPIYFVRIYRKSYKNLSLEIPCTPVLSQISPDFGTDEVKKQNTRFNTLNDAFLTA